jgi:hypothetical protein
MHSLPAPPALKAAPAQTPADAGCGDPYGGHAAMRRMVSQSRVKVRDTARNRASASVIRRTIENSVNLMTVFIDVSKLSNNRVYPLAISGAYRHLLLTSVWIVHCGGHSRWFFRAGRSRT